MKRWILIVLAAACGDNHQQPDARSVDAPGDAIPDAAVQMGVVTAHAVIHSLTEAGEVTAPIQNLELIDSADNIIMPLTNPDGTLRFTPVAAGPYLICDISFSTRTVCAQASVPMLDLDHYVVGRLDAVRGGAGTSLSLTITNATAAPASSNEFLDLRMLNTNDFEYPNAPTGSNTSEVLPLNFQNRELIGANDVIRVTQLVTKTSGSESYVAAVRSGSLTGIAMQDGQPATATLALDNALAQTHTNTFNLRRSQFDGIAGSAGPGFTYVMNDLNGFSEYKPYDYQPWVFYYVSSASPTDLPLTFTFGDPWPSTNTETFSTGFWYQRSVTAPGASSASPITMFTAIYRPTAELTGDVVPKLSRATALQVNGADATVAQTATTTTPTITWTAPSLGTASKYTLSVYRIINQNGATVATVDGMFDTTSTSFRIPPGYIHVGEAYMISIRAMTIPGYSSASPFAPVARYELAETITEILQP